VIAKSSESGVGWFLWPQYVVYHSLDGDYGLHALEEICSNLLPLYGKVCLLGEIYVMKCGYFSGERSILQAFESVPGF
jgi:hypothetical protein